MTVPVVAIVGRPNVGKSSLFNWLAGRRIAIVDPTAGVTRDRVSTLLHVKDRFIELVDTGGMGIEDVDNLTTLVERQIDAAIDQANVILFVVDGRSGLMPLDEQVVQRLRYVDKPVILVANKCDHEGLDPQTAEFYKLGRGKLVCVSAQQNRNKDELLKLILARLPRKDEVGADPKNVALKLAIVGRRNTGKSTFINALAEDERMIVSEVPGTTRDSVDVRFERDGLAFIAIDTAGVRKKRSIAGDIEFYSMARSERSIRRADVVLLFFDPKARISKVDKQLAEYVLEQHKPAIFVVNKWDTMLPTPTGRMATYIRSTFPSLDYVPIAFTTAKEGRNVFTVLNLAQNLHKQASVRVETSDLNRVIRDAIDASPPPLRQNRRAKIYYATQVSTNPPTIVLFTNSPDLFDNTYRRYLSKEIRDRLGAFRDVPIKLHLRKKARDDDETEWDSDAAGQRAKKQPPAKKKRKTGLKFKTKLENEDLERDRQSELWTDL
jgi:GTP-binding protein